MKLLTISSFFFCTIIQLFGDNAEHSWIPTFLIEPPTKAEFSNSSGTVIPCAIDGKHSASVKWVFLDGLDAVDIPGLRYTRHDGSLAFPPFKGEDYRADVHAAVYRCVVSSSFGTIGSRDVHVRAVVPQNYEIRLFDEYVLKGNMAVIRCPVPGYVSDYAVVTAWERTDGFLITPDILSGKFGILDNGDLYVRDVVEQDSSFGFRCHTENMITREKKSSSNYAKIVMTVPNHNQPPRIIRRSSKLTVMVGHKATLTCIAQGYPAPKYRWSKRVGDQLRTWDLGMTTRQEDGVLFIREALLSDRGKYVCLVSNTVGEENVETELLVEDALHVSISPEVSRVDVGEPVTFNCSSGASNGLYSWAKDMKTLQPFDARVSFPIPSILSLRRVQRSDAGIYQCFVHRDVDSAQAATRLIINDSAPKMKRTFYETTVRQGVRASMSCSAAGNPPPTITWVLDDFWPIIARPPNLYVGFYTLSDMGLGDIVIGYVNISSVDIMDSGVYKCIVQNEAGSVSHAARLNVYGPLVVRQLNNLTALSGKRFSVHCPFGGYPFDDIRWRKEEKPLPLNQRQKVFPNGTLVIEEVAPELDDGQYSCEVTSGQQRPVFTTFKLTIRTNPKVSSFAFKEDLHQGMRTAVTCIVAAGDPPFTIQWWKDGRKLSSGSTNGVKVMYGEDGFVSTLTIQKLVYHHNGNYTCSATNDGGTGSHSAMLIVKIPPRWVIEPSDVSAIRGRPSRIDCQAEGVPQPHLRWKMSPGGHPNEFKTIVSSSNVHILVNGSLNFRSVQQTDAGHYLCEANNGVGASLNTVVKFSVHSAPMFQTKFLTLTTRKGNRTLITCNADGDPPMSFSWRRNGVHIDPEREPRYSQAVENNENGQSATLFIDKAERKDSALFTCLSSNNFGEDTMNLELTVQDIPDAPQNLEIHDVSSRSVRLTWNRPFDGNSPITQYTMAWRLMKGEAFGGPQSVPGTETTLTIRNLLPLTRYFFRVKCENTLGESQYSAEVAVTTLNEPPRTVPRILRAFPLSSRSVNVTWQMSENDPTEKIDGFYVGYRLKGSAKPFSFEPVKLPEGISSFMFRVLPNLERFTEYSVVIQAYNDRGAGTPSEEIFVRTLEFDPPEVPVIISIQTSTTSVNLSWELESTESAPVTGFIFLYRTEGVEWQEKHLPADMDSLSLQNLKCGTVYYCYLVAFNSAGRGNGSDVRLIKTNGSAPLAPEKATLLQVNATTARVNLHSWKDGGCPISFFVVQYKTMGHREWTLVSNNIVPRQHNVTISDLSPGTWYSLLMTANNDPGTTEAEYLFATLTLTGDSPPPPSDISNANIGSMYRHLTVTVPIASSALVLAMVLLVVCIITRRRTSSVLRPRTPDGAEGSETLKPGQMPLSVTYDSTQDPAYFPNPYAAGGVQGYGRKPQPMSDENPRNLDTFGSMRSGYVYDIPYPPARRPEKIEGIYEAPVLYLPSYHQAGIDLMHHKEQAIYEVPDRGRRSSRNSRGWRDSGDGNSSTESENEGVFYSLHSDKIVIKEECRESETECDRLWKTLEGSQYEDVAR